MNPNRVMTFVIAAFLLSGCSTDDKKNADQSQTVVPIPDAQFTADLKLPGNTDTSNIKRVGSVAFFLPAQAVQHFGQQAPVYRSYSFVGQASAEYRVNDKVARAEIVQFGTAEDAYGFYAYYRPNSGVTFEKMGAECYVQKNSIVFVMGDYVVTVYIATDSANIFESARPLATEIVLQIGGRPIVPSYYLLFPYRNKIEPSHGYTPVGFLGVSGLNKVFTCNYLMNGDTAQLFYTMDAGGEKFLKLAALAEKSGKTVSRLRGFDYDQNNVLVFDYPEQGVVVAGLVSRKLVGIINYNPKKNESLIKGWVTGLK